MLPYIEKDRVHLTAKIALIMRDNLKTARLSLYSPIEILTTGFPLVPKSMTFNDLERGNSKYMVFSSIAVNLLILFLSSLFRLALSQVDLHPLKSVNTSQCHPGLLVK